MKKRKSRKVSHRNIAVLVILVLFLASAFTLTSQQHPIITGAETGVAYVNVTTLVELTFVNGSLEYGRLRPRGYNSSFSGQINGRPSPFVINNSGNIDVNLTISAATSAPGITSPLFQTVTSDSYYFTIRCGNASGISPAGGAELTPWGGNCTGTGKSVLKEINWTYIPSSAPSFPQFYNMSFRRPQLFFHLNITVPPGEPPANLTSTVTFTATSAE